MGSSVASDVSMQHPQLHNLEKEVIQENDLKLTDVLAVARASLQSTESGGMNAYTAKATLCHIEVSSR